MSVALSINKHAKQKVALGKSKLASDDMEVVLTLEKLKNELDYLHNNLDYVTEPALIDSCIYEIKALHMKYTYYLQECKKRGLIAETV